MIDPVTGHELDPAWQDAAHMPTFPKAGDPGLLLLVLLGKRKNDPPDGKYVRQRMFVGRFNENVQTIGGMFAFDMPPIVAWQHVPPTFKF